MTGLTPDRAASSGLPIGPDACGLAMTFYASLADDYFLNMTLNTEMALPSSRDTVLEFYGRVQRSYPEMRNFYTRESGDHVLEEEKENPSYRWMSLEPRRICSGAVNPGDIDAAVAQHRLALELAPFMLSVSPLDCEALDCVFGFDFAYRGNHDELVAEALGGGGALDSLMRAGGGRTLNFEPSLTIALDEQCRRQARVSVETRTSAYQVRRGEFAEDQISVYFTVRQYGSLPHDGSLAETFDELRTTAEELFAEHVADQVLRPLQTAIATQ